MVEIIWSEPSKKATAARLESEFNRTWKVSESESFERYLLLKWLKFIVFAHESQIRDSDGKVHSVFNARGRGGVFCFSRL